MKKKVLDDREYYDQQILAKLIQIGISLSSAYGLKETLKLITREARQLTNSDAGSLYIREKDNSLRFLVSQCDSLNNNPNSTISRTVFREHSIPITTSSIAGYVALFKVVEMIEDAYHLPPGKPYEHSKTFDQQNNYKTKSILTVPMLDPEGDLVGVLQLINHQDSSGATIAYPQEIIPLVQAVASQAAVAIRNAQLTEELKQTHYDTILRLSAAIEYRDNETGNHVRRVSEYSRIIARNLGKNELYQEMITAASPLHDIGKIGIPDVILLKPDRLTDQERSVMQTHAEIGAQIMSGSDSPIIQMCEQIARTHHEKWNGSGYPNQLEGEDIPLAGRIVALADVFDAIASKRCYKDAVPFHEVLKIVKEESGKHFDPACVEAFMAAIIDIREVHDRLSD